MKRKAPPSRAGAKPADIRKQMSDEQLRGIGLVAIAWNEVAWSIDNVLLVGLRLVPGLWLDIVAQFQETKKPDLIKKCAAELKLIPEMDQAIDTTVAAIGELKAYRDAAVHATVFDAASGIGQLVQRGGVFEVLRSVPALTGLSDRLIILHDELACVSAIFNMVWEWTLQYYATRRASLDPQIAQTEPELQQWLMTLRHHQANRLSLPPLPPFPK